METNDRNADEVYMDNLVDEAIAELNEEERTQQDSVEPANKKERSKRLPKINKPLLIIGMIAIIAPMVYLKFGSTHNSDNSKIDTASTIEPATESVNVTEDVVWIEQEETTDNAMKGKHLTNIPVVVTEEVDAYFQETVLYLKKAMTVDNFIASNELYGNVEFIKAYNKLLDDFNEIVDSWGTHSIPEGCEEYDRMIVKSLDIYQYYFTEVADACNLATSEEEYRNKLQASAAYLQASIDYSDTAEEFLPVFYYYGLYN